ncbi:hypothetical protein [Streptomyces buecherae]
MVGRSAPPDHERRSDVRLHPVWQRLLLLAVFVLIVLGSVW